MRVVVNYGGAAAPIVIAGVADAGRAAGGGFVIHPAAGFAAGFAAAVVIRLPLADESSPPESERGLPPSTHSTRQRLNDQSRTHQTWMTAFLLRVVHLPEFRNTNHPQFSRYLSDDQYPPDDGTVNGCPLGSAGLYCDVSIKFRNSARVGNPQSVCPPSMEV